MLDRRVTLLVNPAAGGGRASAALPAVEAALRAQGLAVVTQSTESLDHARELAAGAAAGGDAVVTLSGDGLIGAVAGALREQAGGLLGVLPGGRGNDFARTLGIPRDPVEACGVVAAGVSRPLDVGDVEGRTFVGIASLGFDSDANAIANAASPRLGGLVYVWGAIGALARWRAARFELRLDGGTPVTYRGYTVAAANAQAYGGGMMMAPKARLDDGLLDVIVLGDVGRLRFVANFPKVFRGTHINMRGVTTMRARELYVDADRPFTVFADGDPIGRTPVTIRSVPGALRVLAPAA